MTARIWPISHLRSSTLFGASVLIFAAILFSLQLAPGQQQQGSQGQFTQQGSKLVGTGAVGNAQQGISVAVSGDGNTAIVGGPVDNSSANNNAGAGAAWFFTQSNGVWSQQGIKLVGTGAIGNAQQGMSVALSDDGNTAIVGGPDDNSSAGNNSSAARPGCSPATREESGPSKAVSWWAPARSETPNKESPWRWSGEGNTAIVGGPGDNSHVGAAWVFTRSGGGWTQQGSKLVGTGGVGAAQGWSVALSEHGNTARGPGDNSHAGATWVFSRSGGVWSQQGSKLVGTGAVGNAQQGIGSVQSFSHIWFVDLIAPYPPNHGVFHSIACARSGRATVIPFERLDVKNDIGCRTASSTSFWNSTISVRMPSRVCHHRSGSKFEYRAG
jgi:hypothetical protein